MNASAASPNKRSVPNVDDLLLSTYRSKQSKQKFDTNIDILASHFCDDATAYGPEFGEGHLLSFQMAMCARPDSLFMFLTIFKQISISKVRLTQTFPGPCHCFKWLFNASWFTRAETRK